MASKSLLLHANDRDSLKSLGSLHTCFGNHAGWRLVSPTFHLSYDLCVLKFQYSFGFQDGIYGGQRLLYHLYIRCARSRQWIRQDEAIILAKYGKDSSGSQSQILEC